MLNLMSNVIKAAKTAFTNTERTNQMMIDEGFSKRDIELTITTSDDDYKVGIKRLHFGTATLYVEHKTAGVKCTRVVNIPVQYVSASAALSNNYFKDEVSELLLEMNSFVNK